MPRGILEYTRSQHFLMEVWDLDLYDAVNEFELSQLIGTNQVENDAENSLKNETGEIPQELNIRPSRRSTSSNTITVTQLANAYAQAETDPHMLIPPQLYGSCDELCSVKAQPFEVLVSPQVGFLTDFHAHLCDAEIIGLLAGSWDGNKKIIIVNTAFPCTATVRASDDGSTDVELDAEAEFKARSAIELRGMRVVGWYHSHPKFRPDPSITDIHNQYQYQLLLRDELSGCEPFVGLIVATYGGTASTPSAIHQWFNVQSCVANQWPLRGVSVPMMISVKYVSWPPQSATYNSNPTAVNLAQACTALVKQVQSHLQSLTGNRNCNLPSLPESDQSSMKLSSIFPIASRPLPLDNVEIIGEPTHSASSSSSSRQHSASALNLDSKLDSITVSTVVKTIPQDISLKETQIKGTTLPVDEPSVVAVDSCVQHTSSGVFISSSAAIATQPTAFSGVNFHLHARGGLRSIVDYPSDSDDIEDMSARANGYTTDVQLFDYPSDTDDSSDELRGNNVDAMLGIQEIQVIDEVVVELMEELIGRVVCSQESLERVKCNSNFDIIMCAGAVRSQLTEPTAFGDKNTSNMVQEKSVDASLMAAIVNNTGDGNNSLDAVEGTMVNNATLKRHSRSSSIVQEPIIGDLIGNIQEVQSRRSSRSHKPNSLFTSDCIQPSQRTIRAEVSDLAYRIGSKRPKIATSEPGSDIDAKTQKSAKSTAAPSLSNVAESKVSTRSKLTVDENWDKRSTLSNRSIKVPDSVNKLEKSYKTDVSVLESVADRQRNEVANLVKEVGRIRSSSTNGNLRVRDKSNKPANASSTSSTSIATRTTKPSISSVAHTHPPSPDNIYKNMRKRNIKPSIKEESCPAFKSQRQSDKPPSSGNTTSMTSRSIRNRSGSELTSAVHKKAAIVTVIVAKSYKSKKSSKVTRQYKMSKLTAARKAPSPAISSNTKRKSSSPKAAFNSSVELAFDMKKRQWPPASSKPSKLSRRTTKSNSSEANECVVGAVVSSSTESPILSLVDMLTNSEGSSCAAARELICSSPPVLRGTMLLVVCLGLYYAGHKRRVGLQTRWKDITKLRKLCVSSEQWSCMMGLCEDDQKRLSERLETFITAVWTESKSAGGRYR